MFCLLLKNLKMFAHFLQHFAQFCIFCKCLRILHNLELDSLGSALLCLLFALNGYKIPEPAWHAERGSNNPSTTTRLHSRHGRIKKKRKWKSENFLWNPIALFLSEIPPFGFFVTKRTEELGIMYLDIVQSLSITHPLEVEVIQKSNNLNTYNSESPR